MRLQALAAALTAGVAAVGLLVLPAQAAPDLPPVEITQCGQSIDRDAYLARDLTCSSPFGILVAQVDFDGPVPSVKIDLRGHTLRGPGRGDTSSKYNIGVAGFGYPGPGVGVEVRNGRLEDWRVGLTSQGSLTATRIRVSNTQVGINCNCRGLVTKSVIEDNQLGTSSFEGGLTLRGNSIRRNAVGSALDSITSGEYSHNRYDKNKVAVQFTWGAVIQLRQNTFTRNDTGVIALEADNTGEYGQAVLDRNIFLANRDGVYLPEVAEQSLRHRLSKNVALGNKRYGFYAPGAEDLGGNIAAGNGLPCVGVVCTGSRR